MVPIFLSEAIVSLLDGIMLLISYISDGTTFPQPLTAEEEKECLKRIKQGDMEAKNKLIEHNMRLVAHIVKKYDGARADSEDLISIGSVGLIKAIESFDPDRKTRLATYAARCIENEILMHLRKTKKLKNEKFLHDPIGSDKEGNEISLIDILGTDVDIVSEEVELVLEQEKLYKRLQNLSNRERKVLEMRYGLKDGKSKTQREIAQQLGISRSYVSRIEKKAVNELHKMFT
ncbi:RNA polymerase sigma-K factor [Halobacteroides halobius DSM 5150]|uniref:RNA polymerase sigma factor n=1 Tax=Halobacteroides halobius (strain ATCC 35273 / DSM 5150 / MD-1) TaxID=748449 RepID=L0KC52_HALHC|nr:RNA polymerase sporulation sigma factor SigK [Halobacteroides halobius]AGB41949.1 RNA polymerase sigma-K factor [Halobacteroides halobius DSM 5150]